MYKNILSKTTSHQDLSEKEIFDLIRSINNEEVSDVQIGAFQVALLNFWNSFANIFSKFSQSNWENCRTYG